MGVVVFDLLSQPVDVDLEHVALAKVVESPHMFQQQVLRDDAPRVLRQIGEDAVLGGRQRDLTPVHRDQMLRIVDGQARRRWFLRSDPGNLRPTVAPDHRAHTRQQFLDAEWFGQVVIGAQVEAANFIRVLLHAPSG